MKSGGFKLSPIILIIIGGLMIVGSLIAHLVITAGGREDREFLANALSTNAVCQDKESYSTQSDNGTVTHYSLLITYSAGGAEYKTTLSSEDPSYDSVSVYDEFELYYNREDPMNCRPAFTFTDHTKDNIVIFIVSLIGLILAVINTVTLVRNLHRPEKLEKPEEIGILGDNTVDNGLSDSSIDYTTMSPSGDNSMDSFVDPFASYTGYDEGQQEMTDGIGFDPNAGYEEYIPEPEIKHGNVDLNDPFVSADKPDIFGGY